jgi:hypothetical protein
MIGMKTSNCELKGTDTDKGKTYVDSRINIQHSLAITCNNKDLFTRNLDIHERNTRRGSDFHYPSSNLTIYQKAAYYMGLKVFNSLPSYIKVKININEIKRLIKNFGGIF